MSLQALLAQLSAGKACIGCAPGFLGQMPGVPAEPNTVAKIPGLFVLPLPRQPSYQLAVKLEERPPVPCPPSVED